MKTNINLISAFNIEARENNQFDTLLLTVNDTVTEDNHKKASRKRSRAIGDLSTAEQMIAKLLPLRDTDGRPVVCCLDYGINYYNRQERYPDGFFCYYCNQFVEDFMLASPRRQTKMIPNSGRYKCVAGHTSLDTPAPLKPHHSLIQDVKGDEDDEDDNHSKEF